jgi:flagellar hook-associated protein 1 FlgK
MAGLFGTLNISTSGLFAQQQAIDVTSHNISNASTDGYSRQRVEMKATSAALPGLSGGTVVGQMGTGVQVTSIDRIRDSFLDYQTRVETGVNGQYTNMDKFLSQVNSVINEPSDTGISTTMGSFFDAWNTLATSPQDSGSRTSVAQQALAVTNQLNQTYTQLENIKSDAQSTIQSTVSDVNSMLTQLNSLNSQIQQVNVSGNNPNDLMDQRDLLLDQLSAKFGINVTSKQNDGIDVTTSNDSTYATTGDNGNAPTYNGTPLNIVQSVNSNNTAKFSYVSSITAIPSTSTSGTTTTGTTTSGTNNYEVVYYKNGDMTTDANKVTIDVTMTDAQYQQLNQCRVLWANNDGVALQASTSNSSSSTGSSSSTSSSTSTTAQTVASLADASNLADSNPPKQVDFSNLILFQPPSGEIKGAIAAQQDISSYEDQLNNLAKSLAFSVNGIISQSSTWKPDNPTDGSEGGINNFFVNSAPADSSNYQASDENAITAGNITVNQAILDDPMKIKTAAQYDSSGNNLSGESDGSRALAIEMLRDRTMTIQNVTSSTTRSDFLSSSVFQQDTSANGLYDVANDTNGMTLDNYFTNTVDNIGTQEQQAKNMLTNQTNLLASFTQARSSVSGVSMDEEMTNLIQYQHAYQANAKVIATVDSLLDVVINGLIK